MTLEEKIGQLFVVGFEDIRLSKKTKEHFNRYPFGNVILFAHNIRDVQTLKSLTAEIQAEITSRSGLPALISIDQEGGMVTRIFNGATFFPGNMAFSAAGPQGDTYLEGRYAGRELRSLGINMNLAPVLDVNSNPGNPVIGVRSYSDDPQRVADLAARYIGGLQAEGVLATGKHFPGHGDTDLDSHLAMPCVRRTLSQAEHMELIPFRRAIEAGVAAIMTSHILFPALEPENVPATLSHTILTGLLREQLGFRGLIITDCLEMKAIDDNYTTEQGAVRAILAGADLVCISHSPAKQADAFEAVRKAVQDGVIPEKRLDESLSRIQTAKQGLRGCSQTPLSPEEIANHATFAGKVSHASITLVRDEGKVLPLGGNRQRTLVLSTQAIATTNADDAVIHSKSFAELFAGQTGATGRIFPIQPTDAEIAAIAAEAEPFDQMIVATYNASIYQQQAKLVRTLYRRCRNMIVVMLRNPYDIEAFPEIPCCVAAYEYTKLSVESAAEALTGKIPFQGSMPVKLRL